MGISALYFLGVILYHLVFVFTLDVSDPYTLICEAPTCIVIMVWCALKSCKQYHIYQVLPTLWILLNAITYIIA